MWQQELIHWKGSHPFKRLQCYLCDHILCRECCTTEVLKVLDFDQVRPMEYHEMSGVVAYGQICPNCGLSHRARILETKIYSTPTKRQQNITFSGVLCVCGRLADNTWLRFWIGPIYQYRCNPHGAFAVLSRQRADKAFRRQQEGFENYDRRISQPASSKPAIPLSDLSKPRVLSTNESISSSSQSEWSSPSIQAYKSSKASFQ